MPYPADVTRYVIRGTGPGSEIWQTGFWLQRAEADQASLQTDTDASAASITTFWNAIKGTIYTSYALTELRTYWYSGGSNQATFEAAHIFTPNPGTNATPGSPIDTCLVASLRTARVGLSYRGRMYLPYHGQVTPGTGLVSGAPATYANAVAALLSDALNMTPVVVSRHLATFEPITNVVVDQRPDVQRRRENRLAVGTPSMATV